jgi:uncharacterized protein (DUF427 family)
LAALVSFDFSLKIVVLGKVSAMAARPLTTLQSSQPKKYYFSISGVLFQYFGRHFSISPTPYSKKTLEYGFDSVVP